MPFCPFCGSENSDDDSFCRSCGAILSGSGKAPEPPRRKDRTKFIAIIIVLIVIASAFAGVAAMLTKDAVTGDISHTYRWDYDGQSFSYTLKVERSYYNKMMDSDIDRSGTVSEGRYVIDGSTAFGVCDYVVVDKYIKNMCQDFCAMYKEKFGSDPTNEQYADFVTAFVQICIDYDGDEGYSNTEYWRYPLETLCDRIGDCEDTSILLAALLDAKGLNGGVILAPGHAMAAILTTDYVPAEPIKHYHSDIEYNGLATGVDYYPIETTYNEYVEIGYIGKPGSIFTEVYLHLYLGSVSDYYVSS